MKRFIQHFIEGCHVLTFGKFRRINRLPAPKDEAFWQRAEQKSTRDPNIGRVELVWHKQEEEGKQ